MRSHKSNARKNIAASAEKIALLFFVLLITFLAGCNKTEDRSDTLQNTETSNPTNNQSADSLLPQYFNIDPTTSEKLHLKCEEIAALCNELMKTGERETKRTFPNDTILTQAAIDDVEDLLAKSGYPVINSDSVYPEYLENSDGIEHFFKLADSGRTAEESLISVSLYNTISYCTFQYDGDEMYYLSTLITWDENGNYEISDTSKQKMIDWGMTYNGYFYYQIYPLDRHWNACSSIRLQPVDKELYDLYVKYLSPANYPSCVFTKDWDKQSYKNICFNDLFESFYRTKYDDFVYAKDYPQHADMSCSLIPASIFEDTIFPYFDISLEEFRTLTLYMEDTNSYPWQELNCSNVIYCPWLTPEVTGKRDNGDGTFTIAVDVLCFDYKCFPRFTHEITIRANSDGTFQYIANRVTYTDEHGVPDTTPRLIEQRNKAQG